MNATVRESQWCQPAGARPDYQRLCSASYQWGSLKPGSPRRRRSRRGMLPDSEELSIRYECGKGTSSEYPFQCGCLSAGSRIRCPPRKNPASAAEGLPHFYSGLPAATSMDFQFQTKSKRLQEQNMRKIKNDTRSRRMNADARRMVKMNFRLKVPEEFRRKPEKFDEPLPVCIEYLNGTP
jgi:hypothetical protein